MKLPKLNKKEKQLCDEGLIVKPIKEYWKRVGCLLVEAKNQVENYVYRNREKDK